jgi:hypothetical protein
LAVWASTRIIVSIVVLSILMILLATERLAVWLRDIVPEGEAPPERSVGGSRCPLETGLGGLNIIIGVILLSSALFPNYQYLQSK